jgi:DNA ligase (NAD+)
VGEAVVRCLNAQCRGQLQRRLEHFASAEAVDIPGLGPATIATLVREGLVKAPADFYRLQPEDLDGLEGIGPASSERLLAAIARSRQSELWRFLYGLGIPQIGASNSRKLANACGSLEALITWDEGQFAAIVGAAAGRAAARYLSLEPNRVNLHALVENGARPAPSRLPPHAAKLEGKVFVFTGTLPNLPRERAAEQVRLAGGIVQDDVTAAVSFVVVGDGAGQKLEDARRLGVSLLAPGDFSRLFEN